MKKIFNVEVGELSENNGMFKPVDIMDLKVRSEFGCTEDSLESLKAAFASSMTIVKDGTYCLIARQKNSNSNNLLAANLKKLESVDYGYMQNREKIEFSACKKNGQIEFDFLKK